MSRYPDKEPKKFRTYKGWRAAVKRLAIKDGAPGVCWDGDKDTCEALINHPSAHPIPFNGELRCLRSIGAWDGVEGETYER